MFISSYEKLRSLLINQKTITSLVQLQYSGFDGATVPICTFTLENAHHPNLKGGYVRLSDFRGSENQGPKTLEAIKNQSCGWFYRASAADFKKIPGSPIAYWVSEALRENFKRMPQIGDLAKVRVGMHTGSNEKFVRVWTEVSLDKIGFEYESEKDTRGTNHKWFPYNKGGSFRKWFGNNDLVVNWQNCGTDIHKFHNIPLTHNGAPVRAKPLQFKESVTWSFVSSAYFGVRYSPHGFMFDVGGSSLFPERSNPYPFVAFLCSKVAFSFLRAMNPTLNFQVGNVSALPFNENFTTSNEQTVHRCIDVTKRDWDSRETSWDFTGLTLLHPDYRHRTLKGTYQKLHVHWQKMTLDMQSLEQENNGIFINAYGLQDELTPEVPIKEITLSCNPHYRYGGDKSEEELEALLLADTLKDFISYAVGCMMGRYSLDHPGIILADAGDTVEHYLSKIGKSLDHLTFAPDGDGILPVLGGEWFEDDIVARTRDFIRATFGEAALEENLRFIEESLGKDLRKYFLTDFYKDHLQTYKKRPIYWLFQSPKKGFSALIYLHRYTRDTVNILLNSYLRDYLHKLCSRIEHLEHVQATSENAREKTAARKESDALKKTLHECEEYEREIILPLAQQRIELNLDDGVKVNYLKFGKALAPIPGLAAKKEAK